MRQAGYGFYAAGGCNVEPKGCNFNTATHGGIMAGDLTAKFLCCHMVSGVSDFMAHDLAGGGDSAAPLEIRNSDCKAEEACLYIKSHNLHVDIENSKLVSPKYAVHAIVNDDPDARKMAEDCIPYGNKLYIKGSAIEGAIVNEDNREMSIVLENSEVKGTIVGAYVELKGSEWNAVADSQVALVNCKTVDGIDAPAGVTITAVAAAGTALSGEYVLPSGGKLIVG